MPEAEGVDPDRSRRRPDLVGAVIEDRDAHVLEHGQDLRQGHRDGRVIKLENQEIVGEIAGLGQMQLDGTAF